MAKLTGYAAFLEDQKKKQQEKANGQVRFKEESTKSRLQYSNPTYTGNSKTANYKWETDYLKDVKMPKGMGKSYNDKFSYLTSQLGMSEGQADEFRKYLNYQEDKNKDAYALKQYEYKKDKDGNLITYDKDGNKSTDGTYLDTSRTSYSNGSGLHLKNDVIDGILNNMTSNAAQRVQNVNERNAEPAKPKEKGFWGKVGDETLKVLEVIDRPGDAVRTGIKEKMNGNGFWQGAKGGFMGDKNTTGTELNRLLGFDPKNNEKDSKIARAISDNLMSLGPTKLVMPFLNEKVKEGVSKELPGQATEVALDPLNLIGGGSAKAVREGFSLPSQMSKVLKGTGSLNYTDDLMRVAAQEAARGEASPIIQQAVKAANEAAPNPVSAVDAVTDTPKATTTNPIDDLLSFAQGNTPKARPTVNKVDPTFDVQAEIAKVKANPNLTGPQKQQMITDLKQQEKMFNSKEDVSNIADTTLNRVNQAESKPKGYYEQRILDIQKAMKDSKNLSEDQVRALNDAQQATEQYKAYEDAHVEQELAPFTEAAQKQAEAQARWENVVKEAKTETERIKGTYGKIKVPKGAGEDYPIPPQFKAGQDNMLYDDIHSFADQEGFSSADEAVQYLRQLDESTKIKLKDMMPEDNYVLKSHEWDALEEAARKNFAKTEEGQTLDKFIADLLDAGQSKPKGFDELYALNKGAEDPASFDELVKLAQIQSAEPGLKTMLQNDPKINELLSSLMGKKETPLKTPDEIIAELTNNPKPQEVVNNSQEPQQVLDQLVSPKPNEKLTVEELNALIRGEKPPKSEPNVTNEVDSENLLGLNLQQFNSDTPPIITSDKPIDSISAIDNIKNPIVRAVSKFRENYINKTQSAKAAHVQVLENAIKKAESDGLTKKAQMLKDQLKNVKKHGSDVEKAIQNQSAAGARAQYFLENHIEKLQDALGSTKPEDMANAIRYQVARNIKWIWKNVNEDYAVPGWDKGTVNTIINEGVANPKLKDFTKAMKELTQERLDLALKYNLINKEAHAALSKNPEYIPMARDVTQGMDNVARGLKNGTTSNKSKSGAYFIQSLGQGDAEALLKDPMETLMSGTFSLFKNMAKADSEKQLYSMAKLDHDHLFSRVITKKEFDKNGGIAVPTSNGTKYIQVQQDLLDMVKESELPYDLNVLGKITSAFAGAKTRSLEYHMTGVPRDLLEGYLKGQTNNPITYLKELVKAAKEHNLTTKQAGAHFNKAYKDGMAGINPEKMMKEYARQNKSVKPFKLTDKESRKEFIRKMGRILDMPFAPIKKIGQLSDELPRTVEIKATEKAFMKEHGTKINNIKNYLEQVNERLDAVKDVKDPFDPRLQGVDKLQGQKAKLENMLNEYDKALQRETTFRGRDLMNFGNGGRSSIAKHIRQYFIFANTTTQSKDKLIRSFVERPAATLGKTALITAPFVYAEQVLQQNLTGKDKEISDNLPFWLKQYNYTYVMDGNVYTIPKIQELALLTNPIEAVLSGNMEDLNDTARLTVKETVPYQMGNFAQGLVPNTDGSMTIRDNVQVPSSVFSPAIDVAANDKLGFNRNAISFADKFGRENPAANKFTLDMFKKVFGDKSRADYAQYLATQYPGDAGKYASFTLDWLTNPSNNDKLDAMLQNLNPLQDRIYSKDGKFFKNPPKKTSSR